MKHLIIIGVGGFAREVYWHAQDSLGYKTEWDLKGFLDGDVKLSDEEYAKLKLPVLGDINSYSIEPDDVFVCAIADPAVKKKLTNIISQRDGNFINLIHKTAIIHGNVKMGIGNIFCPFSHVFDSSVIGNHVIFNCQSGLGHDSKVGDYSSFMGYAGLNGYAQAGNEVYFGDGAIALPHSKIEDRAYIGARSVVFKRVREGQKVFGNPALPI